MITAELLNQRVATACGVTVKSSRPLLHLAQRLIAAGHPPWEPFDLIMNGEAVISTTLGACAALATAEAGRGDA